MDLLEKGDKTPDLILSDIMMPVMNGYDFYKHIAENPKWRYIPFIFLTAKSDREDIRFGKMLGVDDYIPKAKSMTVVMNIPDDISVLGDQTRLGQVIRILLDNAVKFSPEKSKVIINAKGGITRQINDIPVTGTLIQVSDLGIGIPVSAMKHLFDRFFRADNARNIQGTGLGLSIAKEFVTLHGGEISVESTPGKGSTFSLFLPSPASPATPPVELPYRDNPSPA